MCPVIFLALQTSRQELTIFKVFHLLLRGQEYDSLCDFSGGSGAAHRDVFNAAIRETVELGLVHSSYAI